MYGSPNFHAPSDGKLSKSLMRRHLGDYEIPEESAHRHGAMRQEEKLERTGP